MATLTYQDINQLKQDSSPVFISIYTPIDNNSANALQSNQIRIKNIVRSINNILDVHKHKLSRKPNEIIQPLYKLLESRPKLWQRHAKSLAVFVSQNQTKYFFLPELTKDKLTVSKSFHLNPIMSMLKANQGFYILSISHEHAQLYRSDMHSEIKSITVPNLPSKGMVAALRIDELPHALQFHPASDNISAGGKAPAQQYHGHHEASTIDQNLLKQYFRLVDTAITRYLKNRQKPLVFAGVDYLYPIYSSVNSYKQLHPVPLEGNYQHSTNAELHQKAVSIIKGGKNNG